MYMILFRFYYVTTQLIAHFWQRKENQGTWPVPSRLKQCSICFRELNMLMLPIEGMLILLTSLII